MEHLDPRARYEREFIRKAEEALKEMGYDGDLVVERPKKGFADLCLVCFPLAKSLSMAPDTIAASLKDSIGDPDIYELEVNGGYLNCTFHKKRYVSELIGHLWSNRGSLGRGREKEENITVEHTSANPNGPFHVGRARNPIIGDSLVRIMRYAGYRVSSQYWVNDMGKQVMILVWGLMNIPGPELPEAEREKQDHDLVRYYQAANAKMEENKDVASEIDDMLSSYELAVKDGDLERRISRPGSPEIKARDVRSACNSVLKGMRGSLSRLNVHLDDFVYESAVVEDGSLWEVIEGLKNSPLCRQEDGAHYLDLSQLIEGGDDDKFKRRFVFTRSDGSALYTTRDLAYHKWKLENCDHAINVLGEDHRYQSLMLSLSLKELNVEKVPEVVFYAFVSLPEGKMSTRRARVVFLDDLLDEAVYRARSEVEKRREDLEKEELRNISEMVGIGALRFNMIKVQPEKKIVFRWEDALNFEGSSAPFVQYSHARACSILRKLGSSLPESISGEKIVEGSEIELIKKLSEFKEVISRSAEDRKVHLLTVYLVDLASTFNEFYRDCPVLIEEDIDLRNTRIALVELTRETLSSGLGILGIEAPPSM